MTTPAERTEAMKMAIKFVESQSKRLPPRLNPHIRYMLRHLPTIGELELTHDKCPELWGKP